VLRISVGVLKMFRIPDDSRIIYLCLLAYVTRTLETRERIKKMKQKLSSDKIDCIIISGETTAKWDVAKKKERKDMRRQNSFWMINRSWFRPGHSRGFSYLSFLFVFEYGLAVFLFFRIRRKRERKIHKLNVPSERSVSRDQHADNPPWEQ